MHCAVRCTEHSSHSAWPIVPNRHTTLFKYTLCIQISIGVWHGRVGFHRNCSIRSGLTLRQYELLMLPCLRSCCGLEQMVRSFVAEYWAVRSCALWLVMRSVSWRCGCVLCGCVWFCVCMCLSVSVCVCVIICVCVSVRC